MGGMTRTPGTFGIRMWSIKSMLLADSLSDYPLGLQILAWAVCLVGSAAVWGYFLGSGRPL